MQFVMKKVEGVSFLKPISDMSKKLFHEIKAERHQYMKERAYERYEHHRDEMGKHLREARKYR